MDFSDAVKIEPARNESGELNITRKNGIPGIYMPEFVAGIYVLNGEELYFIPFYSRPDPPNFAPPPPPQNLEKYIEFMKQIGDKFVPPPHQPPEYFLNQSPPGLEKISSLSVSEKIQPLPGLEQRNSRNLKICQNCGKENEVCIHYERGNCNMKHRCKYYHICECGFNFQR